MSKTKTPSTRHAPTTSVALLSKTQREEAEVRQQSERDDLLASLDSLSRFYRNGGNMKAPLAPRPYKDDAEMIRLLKQFRLGLGYTQENFAQIFGISLKTLQRWEAEKKGPIADSLKALVHGILAAPGVIADANKQKNLSPVVQHLIDEPNETPKSKGQHKPRNSHRKDKTNAN